MQIDWYDRKNDPLIIIKRIQKERGITKKEAEKIVRKMVPDEGEFQSRVKKAVIEAYPEGYTVKIQQAQYSTGGIPDLMTVIKGHYFGFEVKRPYFHKKSELQKKTIEQIRAAGGTADFISYADEALEMIEEYFKNGR